MRMIVLAVSLQLALSLAAFSCSCGGNATYCSALNFDGIVFLGTALVDSKGPGTGLVAMQVDEVFRGLPTGVRQVTVDPMAQTSCHFPLQKGEQYMVLGGNRSRISQPVKIGGCSFSFKVRGNEALFRAVRNALLGGPSMLVGRVAVHQDYSFQNAPVSSLKINAVGGDTKLQTDTFPNGEFLFSNVASGKYRISVAGDDFFEESFRSAKPDVVVHPNGCGYQYLSVWPNGKIEGTVRATDGLPRKDVPVQAFLVDEKNAVGSSPLRTAKSDEQGRYELRGLPDSNFVIGVNGKQYNDEVPWKATFYPATSDASLATRVKAGRSGVDIVLPRDRQPSKLHVSAVFEDGTLVSGFTVSIKDLSGVQRGVWHSNQSKTNEPFGVPVYVGETYKVEVSFLKLKSELVKAETGTGYIYRGNVTSWSGQSAAIKIEQEQVHVRVVLHRDPERVAR